MKEIINYQNGNVKVQLFEDGTRIMEFDETKPVVFDYPNSMDIKITNQCVGIPSKYGMGDFKPCAFCHEKSHFHGKHADINALIEVLDVLPGGQEMAVGGGNPLSHPDLPLLLQFCQTKKIFPSLTVNFHHLHGSNAVELKRYMEEKLIYGLGVSIPIEGIDKCSADEEYFLKYEHTVAHLIIGLHTPEIITQLRDRFGLRKFLLLGYKEFGRGLDYYKSYSEDIKNNIVEWDRNIIKIVSYTNVISFDNLSIEQLDMENKIPPKYWEENYQGDDFSHTMYIDAIEQKFAPTSRSDERVSWSETTLLKFFRENRNVFK